MITSRASKFGIAIVGLVIAAGLGATYFHAARLLWDPRAIPGVIALAAAAIVVTTSWLLTVMFFEFEEDAPTPEGSASVESGKRGPRAVPPAPTAVVEDPPRSVVTG
ncbi:MAG: hypothetical protein RL885_13410 [Planctomycetota bacterium]